MFKHNFYYIYIKNNIYIVMWFRHIYICSLIYIFIKLNSSNQSNVWNQINQSKSIESVQSKQSSYHSKERCHDKASARACC